ncbi:MAG: hypothetical protein ACK4K0_00305 [Flavobacteriales bacterium]
MNQKSEITKLTDKILIVTIEIKDNFPDIYKDLDDIPLFDFPDKKELNSNDFEEYLAVIQVQLETIVSNLNE